MGQVVQFLVRFQKHILLIKNKLFDNKTFSIRQPFFIGIDDTKRSLLVSPPDPSDLGFLRVDILLFRNRDYSVGAVGVKDKKLI